MKVGTMQSQNRSITLINPRLLSACRTRVLAPIVADLEGVGTLATRYVAPAPLPPGYSAPPDTEPVDGPVMGATMLDLAR